MFINVSLGVDATGTGHDTIRSLVERKLGWLHNSRQVMARMSSETHDLDTRTGSESRGFIEC